MESYICYCLHCSTLSFHRVLNIFNSSFCAFLEIHTDTFDMLSDFLFYFKPCLIIKEHSYLKGRLFTRQKAWWNNPYLGDEEAFQNIKGFVCVLIYLSTQRL